MDVKTGPVHARLQFDEKALADIRTPVSLSCAMLCAQRHAVVPPVALGWRILTTS